MPQVRSYVYNRYTYIFCHFLITIIFIADSIFPVGYDICFLFLIPIAVVSRLERKSPVFIITILSTLLTTVSFFIAPVNNIPAVFDIVNRIISIVTFWVLSFMLMNRSQMVKRLKESEEYKQNEAKRAQLAAIVEHSNDAIFSKTLDGVITSWNTGAEKMYGYSAEEAIGNPVSIIIPPEYLEEMNGIISKVRTNEAVQNIETLRKRKDGTLFNVSLTVSPIRDLQNQIIGVSSVAQDITYRKQIEEDRKSYAEKLQIANKELESFTYSVAHDLKAPVRSMISFSTILNEEYAGKLDETGRDYLNRVARSGQKMSSLIDNMLTLSKITRQELAIKRVDLTAISNDIVNDLRESHPERKISISISNNMQMNADESLIRIALQNLIRNAWKFSSKTENPFIEISSKDETGQTIFFIKDNGAGFDSQQKDKLFEPFKRLHSESEFPGTGIGLAIVQRVIQKHGGKIWAEGVKGEGATFFFTLET
jgi:PAS domain S-box-containing protein